MASIRLRRTKEDGSKVYQIRATRQRGQAQKSISWTAPAGWSQKAIDRELAKIAADLDRGVKSGEILTRAEKKAKDQAAAEEEAKIKTVRQYAESVYIPGKEGECSIRTVEYYKNALTRFIYPAIGNSKMTDVRAIDLKNIILNAQRKGLSYSTVRGIYLTMAQLFDQANKDDMIEVDPMTKVSAPRRRKDEVKREIEVFTDEELLTIRECLAHESLKWKAFFNFMLDTGARKGEVCAIKWENIDFKERCVKIDATALNVQRPDGSGCDVIVNKPKNGKTRNVYPSAEIMQMLREMQLQSGRFDYVFVQTRMTVDRKPINEPLSPQSADRYLRTFTKKYGIDFKMNPHKFRHTAATKMLASGVPLADASRVLGHSDPSVTARFYLHSNDDAVKQASEIYQKAIGRA